MTGKSCDVGQISICSPQIKGTYAAINVTEDVTEDTGQNSQLYNSAMSPRCNKSKRKPKKNWTDEGTEFYNKTFMNFL